MLLTVPIRDVAAATPRARIVRLDLGAQAFAYAAGQAVMAGAHAGERRPFSIANAPEDAARDRALELLVGTEPTDVSGGHFIPVAGALADIEGPIGTFTFPSSPPERRFLFVAGGTGIAPLRAMLGHALTIGADSLGLFYSARTPEEFAYEHEFRALARDGRLELRQTITRSTAADWQGTRGRVSHDALAALLHDPATLCFVCGPPALVDEVPKMLMELGVPRARIRVEGGETLG